MLGIGVVLAALVGIFTTVGRWSRAPQVAAKGSACVASQLVECPTAEFLASVKRLKELQADIAVREKSKEFLAIQRESDELSGMGMRLQKQVPEGFSYDDGKAEFVRRPLAPLPQLPPATKPEEPASKPEGTKKP